MKKLLWLLVILMLLTVTASADSTHMPDSLVSIQTEAFMGDTFITEVDFPTGTLTIGDRAFMNCENLATVVLPDTVTMIGEQAFANCGSMPQEIRIPDSVTEIGVNAFPYGTVLCGKPGSYAEQYVEQYATETNGYTFRAITQRFIIGDVYVDYYEAYVMVTCEEACILRVDILDEYQESLLLTGTSPCEAGMDQQSVTVSFEEELPEYFALRAVLEDTEGNALCEPVLWLDRVPEDPFKDFNAKTPADFTTGTVLNYGEDGFAVLQDDVRIVTGSESEGLYTVVADSEICEGDCLYLSNINALVLACDVTNNGDGSYVMRSDAGAALYNFYKYINCHGIVDAGEPLDSQPVEIDSQETADLARITKKFSLGSVTAGITAGTSVSYDIRYDCELFGPWFLSCDVWAETDASISVAASREYTLEKEWLVYSRNQPTEVPGLLITTDQYLILDLAAKAEASATAAINGRVGFRYDTNNGFRPIRNCEAGWDITAGAEASCKVGPKIAVGISFLRLLSAEFSGEAGCEMKAETTLIDAQSDDAVQDRKHACTLCFDLNVSTFTSVDTSIKSLGIHLDDHNLYENEISIFEGYLSVLNEDESVHQGKIVIGRGECPNYKYRTSIKVQDPDEPDAVKTVSLYRIVNRVERILITEETAPFTVYLYPGEYVVETDHLDVRERMNFMIEDEALDLLLDFTLIPIDEEHFPDAVFRELVSGFDLDKDGYLSCWERGKVNTIYFNYWEKQVRMESMQGIGCFYALKSLTLDSIRFSTLDLSKNGMLRDIAIAGIIEGNMNVSGCHDLISIYVCSVGELDVSNNLKLEELHIEGGYTDYPSAITQLDLRNLPSLRKVRLDDCFNLTQLLVANNPSLQCLWVENGKQLASLDVSNLTMLEELIVCSDALETLYMDGCSALRNLQVVTASMTYLNLTMLPSIKWIDISNLGPAELTVNATHRYYSTLDISPAFMVEIVSVSGNAVVCCIDCNITPTY